MIPLEFIGYTGSALVALSLTMSNLRRLRWINLFGASTFATYGFLIEAWPVFALNSFITLIDIYHLIRMSRRSDYFSLMRLPERPSPFLNRFLEFHGEEIARHMPDFNPQAIEKWEGFWLLRNMLPVGLFVHRWQGEELEVLLDYVIPEHRDYRNGRWLFREGLPAHLEKQPRRIVSHAGSPRHVAYLKKLGFSAMGPERWQFEPGEGRF